MDASELRARARQEADELGPQPPGTEAHLWREERWGAVVLLAGLADDDAELLRQAASEVAAEWTDQRRPGCCWTRRPSLRSAPNGGLSQMVGRPRGAVAPADGEDLCPQRGQ